MEGKVVKNEMKNQFMGLLLEKDDDLIMQTTGLLLQLVMHSKTSQALLYYSRLFPLGVNRKSMLL
jgi:hypothetical protein